MQTMPWVEKAPNYPFEILFIHDMTIDWVFTLISQDVLGDGDVVLNTANI